MRDSFVIPPRFHGPPGMGNGGYAAGLFARGVGQPVTVRLLQPIPLDTELSIHTRDEGSWSLEHDGVAFASARTAQPGPALALPTPPSPSAAADCAARYVRDHKSPYARCFVCGAEREPRDGLAIFAGAVEGSDLVAAPWTPAEEWADDHGRVRSELIWAALDCPGYFAAFADRRPALLGELSVREQLPVLAGEEYIVVGWPLERSGRKRRAATALFDRAGALHAVGEAIWIELQAPL